MDELSKLTVGYHTAGRGYDDILGPEIAGLSDFLLQVGQSSQIKIAAWFSTQGGSAVCKYPAVRIMLEGRLSSLETGLNQIIEHEGVPTFVDRPELIGILPYSLFGRFVKPSPDSPTTPDAYQMVKGMYRREGVGTSIQNDNTLVRSY